MLCGDCGKREAIGRCCWQTRAYVRVGSEHDLPLCASCVRGHDLHEFLTLPHLEGSESIAAYAALPSFVEAYGPKLRSKIWVCSAHFHLAFSQHMDGLVFGGETRQPPVVKE